MKKYFERFEKRQWWMWLLGLIPIATVIAVIIMLATGIGNIVPDLSNKKILVVFIVSQFVMAVACYFQFKQYFAKTRIKTLWGDLGCHISLFVGLALMIIISPDPFGPLFSMITGNGFAIVAIVTALCIQKKSKRTQMKVFIPMGIFFNLTAILLLLQIWNVFPFMPFTSDLLIYAQVVATLCAIQGIVHTWGRFLQAFTYKVTVLFEEVLFLQQNMLISNPMSMFRLFVENIMAAIWAFTYPFKSKTYKKEMMIIIKEEETNDSREQQRTKLTD